MITIAVPPALPACLAIATVLSIGRLRRKDVFVTSPERVAMAGQLDVICFDKTGGVLSNPEINSISFWNPIRILDPVTKSLPLTGTLTEQGLDLQGIVEVVQEEGASCGSIDETRPGPRSSLASIHHPSGSSSSARFRPMASNVGHLSIQLQQLLATCHGLARMSLEDGAAAGAPPPTHSSLHQSLVGDPLDQKLFLATRWELVDGTHSAIGDKDKLSGAGGLGQQTHDASGAPRAQDVSSPSEEQLTYVRPPRSTDRYTIIKRWGSEDFNGW